MRSIPWTDISWTSSPRIFKVLKDAIVKLKDEGKVLLRMVELKQQLDMRLPGEQFSLDELRAVVGLLAGLGVVWQLDFGDFVLLQPERINAYAAAVIRSVRAHMDEIGCISEERVLAGDKLPIGSGQVESAVRRVINLRFKAPGLFWTEARVSGLMHLRAACKAGRWDDVLVGVVTGTFHVPSFKPVGTTALEGPADAQCHDTTQTILEPRKRAA